MQEIKQTSSTKKRVCPLTENKVRRKRIYTLKTVKQ